MPHSDPSETPHERKTRERLELLALPPKEAQERVSLHLTSPLRDLTPPGQDLRSPLAPPRDDEDLAQ